MDRIDVTADGYAALFEQLRAKLAARWLAAENLSEATDLELQIMAMSKHLPPPCERPLTASEADALANSLTGGAMSIVETNGQMVLRGAAAKSGVRLFRYLTTRAGIAAAVMEYYRQDGAARAPARARRAVRTSATRQVRGRRADA